MIMHLWIVLASLFFVSSFCSETPLPFSSVIRACSCQIHSFHTTVRSFIYERVSTGEYKNLRVEWIKGEKATVAFYTKFGKEISKFDLTEKMTLSELKVLFHKHNFPLEEDKMTEVYWQGNLYQLYPDLSHIAKANLLVRTQIVKDKTGHLVCIESDEEQKFLDAFLEFNNVSSIWLGASDIEKEGKWTWNKLPSRKPFWDLKKKLSGYTNWATEPTLSDKLNCAVHTVGLGWKESTCREEVAATLIEFENVLPPPVVENYVVDDIIGLTCDSYDPMEL
jgi:hypothetical protein